MKAIILSAGQGRRLLPLTADKPKSAIAVLDRSVLEWQLGEIAQCAVDEVVVVTGFAADVIDDIARRQTAVKVRTLYNPFFAQCDNLGTCWIARHEMQGDFIIVNGDTLFEAAIMRRLLATDVGAAVTLAGESIGMMCFRREGGARFTAQLDHMMRYGTGLKQWYLAAVDKLADDGLVATCPIDGLSWCEIDDRADLERAARVVSAWYPARGVSAAG